MGITEILPIFQFQVSTVHYFLDEQGLKLNYNTSLCTVIDVLSLQYFKNCLTLKNHFALQDQLLDGSEVFPQRCLIFMCVENTSTVSGHLRLGAV